MRRDALAALRVGLDAALVGQEGAKTGLLLALIAREHACLEGPPGCGKTRLAEALASVSGARVGTVRFHRDLRETDLLGTARLRRARTPGGERLWRETEPGALLDAEIAILDDFTRAPGEALGQLLRVLGERRVLGRTLPLETAVATVASAHPAAAVDPMEPGQLDRFAVQVRMKGLLTGGDLRGARAALERGLTPAPAPLSTAERRELQRRVAAVRVGGQVRHLLVSFGLRIAKTLGGARGALVTDRAFLLAAVRILRAHALLRGARRVDSSDLRALRYMMAGRIPEGERDAFEAMLAEAMGERAPRRPGAFPVSPRRGRPGSGGAPLLRGSGATATETTDPALEPRAEAGEVSKAGAEVKPLLRALRGRVERARADRGEDPGGQPRRYRPLRELDEILECDPVDAVLFVGGSHPGGPRAYRRERKNRGGTLALLRDVSASMEGRLSGWSGEIVAAVIAAAARRRMRVGYIEFNHEAERFAEGGLFFHRAYARLLALAARRRAVGRTSYEAPLRAALEQFRGRVGRERHLVLLTDGVPVLGDPRVVRERAEAKRLGVRVHTVFLGLGDPPMVLEEIARETGGVRFVGRPGIDGRLSIHPLEARR